MDEREHAAVATVRLHGEALLELLTDLPEGQPLFEPLPDLRACGVETVVGGALQMEEDCLAILQDRIDHLRMWSHVLIQCIHGASLWQSSVVLVPRGAVENAPARTPCPGT